MGNSVVYLNESLALENELRLNAEMTNLFYERASVYEKSVKDKVRVVSTSVVFLGLSLFWSAIADSVYVQNISAMSFGTMLIISAINLGIVFVLTFVGYIVVFNFVKLLTMFHLYNKGKFFHRKANGFVKLYHKVTNGSFTEMFFMIDGVVSKVTVSNYYGSLHEIGDKVPVRVDYVLYKGDNTSKIVTDCVGSRCDTFGEFVHENTYFYVNGQHKAHQDNMSRIQASTGSTGRLGISTKSDMRLLS